MITIVDYQMGNLRSVQKAFEHLGVPATICSDPTSIASAEKVVLPGVGSFGEAMRELGSRDLVPALREFVATGRPFLGICLGLQLLFDCSDEGGEHAGLGIVPGKVVRFEGLPKPLKVPHMGWNTIEIAKNAPVLGGIPNGSHFYFVHSHFVIPNDESVIAVRADYGAPFCAMVWQDNIMAAQFHPEKSQAMGLRLLSNFATM